MENGTLLFSGLLIGAALFLASCTPQPVNLNKAYYWQRSNVSEATYLEGPKAQQMLHRDIAQCVTEIRELERLGAIRTAIPGETLKSGIVPDPSSPEGMLKQWDTPDHDAYLRAEHMDYHDFETCMIAKGWERVQNLPYETAARAREDYRENVLRPLQDRQQGSANKKPSGSFSNLNE